MAQLNVSELDFDQIKTNLKTFLSAQTEFQDYNFEGSGMSVLIDLLAYNTHYNGMLAHMLTNESFIDTAIKRESVVSIAKSLGYTPRSYLGSTATINLVVTVPASFNGTSVTLSRNASFGASVDGKSYSFQPVEDVTVNASVSGSNTQFVWNNLLIREGTRVSNKFSVSSAKPQGPYVIPNSKVDTTTIRAMVQESLSDLTVSTWLKSDKILDVKNDSKIYWVEEGIDALSQLRFGDGVIGKKLDAGNLILIDYIVASGPGANNAKTFSANSRIAVAGETVSITTVSNSSGGNTSEKIDEIRHNAPRFNATRDRAVTEQDYKTLILSSNSNIQSCAVWGGEKNDPPMYGRVFISLNPVAGQIITEQDKENIKSTIIDPKTPIAIMPTFVDPEFTYIKLGIGVTYDPKITVLTKGEMEVAAKTSVNNYFNTSLNKLNKSFYYTKLHDGIKAVSDSIISINIQLGLQKRIKPKLNSPYLYEAKFNQKLQPRELKSSYFNITVNNVIHKVYLSDTPAATVIAPTYSGTGIVNAINTEGNIVSAVGTIDYDSGTVTLPSMTMASLYGTETHLRITVTPHDSIKDITTQALIRTSDTSTAAVVAKPSRNTVLILDDSKTSSLINTDIGVAITATQDVEEI